MRLGASDLARRLRRRWLELGASLRAPRPEDPWLGLVPPLNRPTFPLRHGALAMGLLVVTAGALLWPLPLHLDDRVLGTAAQPGGLPTWMAVARHGGALADLVLVPETNFPLGTDLVAREGWPLDAVLALPLHALFGWPDWFNLGAWMWVAALGWGAAWLGNRWWNDPWAGFACGVGYQACNLAGVAVAEGRLGHVAALGLLPVAAGLWIRALDRGTWAAAGLCGVPVAALALADASAGAWVAVAGLLPLLLTLGARRWEAAWVACTGTLASAMALGGLPMAWRFANRSLVPVELGDAPWIGQVASPLAALVALAGVLAWGRSPRRLAWPLALVLVGALWPDGPGWNAGLLAPAEVALALLAGGLVLRLRALPARWGTVASAAVPLVLLGAAWTTGLRPFPTSPWPMSPWPTTPWPPDTAILAGEAGAPVLVLPYPGAGAARAATWDQLGHQRPLVNGRAAPGSSGTVDPVTVALHRRYPTLDTLARLGTDAPVALDAADLAALRGLGIDRVYVDLDAMGLHADRARAQILALEAITGPHTEAGRFWIVPLPPTPEVRAARSPGEGG